MMTLNQLLAKLAIYDVPRQRVACLAIGMLAGIVLRCVFGWAERLFPLPIVLVLGSVIFHLPFYLWEEYVWNSDADDGSGNQPSEK